MLVLNQKLLKNLERAAGSSDMYYGIQWDMASAQFEKLQRHGFVTAEYPHNPIHKVRAIITDKGREYLESLKKPASQEAKAPKYLQSPKREKVSSKEITDLWDENEKSMGEQAALHVACEMLDIDVDDAYDIMANAS